MKKLHIFIIKSYLKPFITTFFIVLFILMMLFLFKYIDEFVGKGVDWFTIAKLIFYANASNVPMALPLAILLSSIMTFGAMGENYELVAIKASGVSLTRAMIPLLLIMFTLSMVTFFFANTVIPQANLKMASIIWGFRQTKPAFLIPEGVFYGGIDGYSIKVGEKDESSQTLYDIILYDHNNTSGNVNVLRAKEGQMFKSPDERYLILKLKDGIRYEESKGSKGREQLTRFKFKEHEQTFQLDGFNVATIDEDLFKRGHQMQSIDQLQYSADSLKQYRQKKIGYFFNNIRPYYMYFSRDSLFRKYDTLRVDLSNPDFLMNIPENDRELVLNSAMGSMRNVQSNTLNAGKEDYEHRKQIKRYGVELNRKFSLAMACMLLFFVGAPLGAIIRKGGLGLPVVVAIVFFLIYYITGTLGEKAAKEGNWTPVAGMWLSSAVLLPIGIFLTYKAASDSALFDVDSYLRALRKIIPRKWRKQKQTTT